MNNAKRFNDVFGIYATELWAMSEKEFLEWLNAECNGDKRMKTHDILIEDLEHMDDALERLAESRDIWQNDLVWWLCKSVRDILLILIKKN